MYMVGDENMPWVPVAILGVVGLVLLVTAGFGGQRAGTQIPKKEIVIDEERPP